MVAKGITGKGRVIRSDEDRQARHREPGSRDQRRKQQRIERRAARRAKARGRGE